METKLKKYKGIHPGAIIARELDKRSMKQRPFAISLDEHPQTFNAILKEKRGISIPLALKVERALGMKEGTLVILQAYYDIEKTKENLPKPTPDLSKLRTSLFWDTTIDEIDWSKHYKAVIKRVFERGNEIEQIEIIRFYGESKVRKVIEEATKKEPYTVYRLN